MEHTKNNAAPVFMVREEPAKRTTTIETEVWIPAIHALIISLAWAIPIGILATIITAATHAPWWYVPLAFLAVAATLFPFKITDYIKEQRRLLWKTEETELQNPNSDNHIAPPTFTVEVVTRNEHGQLRAMHNLDFGVDDATAMQFIRGVLQGKPITESQWTGNRRPFSKSKYNPMRDMLISQGILTWRNADAPAQGIELTGKGRNIFEQLAAQHT